ncbi:biotin-dependent carboxyltransferase family protein [Tumebacillus flagellatus]|uniref:5-oxoprolinase subunit C family protein n=1 Tax=Tumebacillus flagellatus TaxID=1157490 RepID=UPI00056E8679|nr:biotin-dependent carboxyltransferase family protein [Tumebacillus flagellatus]
MSLQVIKPGLLTTLQDLGRYGFQRYGVMAGGAMDSFALRTANLLVGNVQGEAALEITLQGPTLRAETDLLAAVCGGHLAPTLDGEPVPEWQSFPMKAGSVLQFGYAKFGCRAYLAVAGGFHVPDVLASKSTFVRGKMGGFEGRALQAGDRLPCGHVRMDRDEQAEADSALATANGVATQAHANGTDIREKTVSPTIAKPNDFTSRHFAALPRNRFISWELFPDYSNEPVIRVTRGQQYDAFDAESRERLWAETFQVTPQSDRMGYRIEGPPLQLVAPLEMISEAVTFGTVQVPPGGNPIVLLADRQTTGGYPKIAQVAAVDLPVLAQLKPGDRLRFTEITVEEAQRLYLERERGLQMLQRALTL